MFDNTSDIFFTRALLIPLDGDANIITFQWNPQSLVIDKQIKWQHLKVAGREQPYQQYSCGEARTFIVPFSISRSNNALDFVVFLQDEFLKFTKPTAGNTVKRPPLCQLILGYAYNIRGIVSDFKIQMAEFYDPVTLMPTSARCVLTLEEYMAVEE